MWFFVVAVGVGVFCAPTPAHAAPPAAPQSGEATGRAIVKSAQRYLGMPYVWGGHGQSGFDCSGLVETVFASHGYQLPRVSRQQALVGAAVHDPFAAGDLLFFSERPQQTRITHVAISLGGSRFIHAALGKGEVSYDHLGERYYRERLVLARRVLALPPGRYATAGGLAVAGAAFDSPGGAQALARQGAPDPRRAAVGADAAAAPAADAVHEHDRPLPPTLARADARAPVWPSFADPFGEMAFLPEETGFAVRAGGLVAPSAKAALAALEGRYFGHGNGWRLDVAFPLALHLVRPGDELDADAGRGNSVRQWGRLLRLLQVGQPDAAVYAKLSRSDAVSLGEGGLMRHFLPNAISAQQSDALLAANSATWVLGLRHERVALMAMLDDVFRPNVSGLFLQVRPRGEHGRMVGMIDWVADWRAPDGDGQPPLPIDGQRAVHGVSAGPAMQLLERRGVRLRAYGLLGLLVAGGRPKSVGVGGHVGVLASFTTPGRGALGPVLSVRLEGRVHSARYRPGYFGFSYAARRLAMPQSLGANAIAPPAASVLAAQQGQPPEASGLLEVTVALGRKVQLGVSYEDGGHLGQRQLGPSFIARGLTAFAALTNISLGGTRVLRLHALYHTSERQSLWPPLAGRLPGTFAAASSRADLLSWLDVGAAVRKPLGPALGWPGCAFVADASAHFAF